MDLDFWYAILAFLSALGSKRDLDFWDCLGSGKSVLQMNYSRLVNISETVLEGGNRHLIAEYIQY